jgi:hypothetical protein
MASNRPIVSVGPASHYEPVIIDHPEYVSDGQEGRSLDAGHSPRRNELGQGLAAREAASPAQRGSAPWYLTPRCFSRMAAREDRTERPQKPRRKELSILRQYMSSGALAARTQPARVVG